MNYLQHQFVLETDELEHFNERIKYDDPRLPDGDLSYIDPHVDPFIFGDSPMNAWLSHSVDTRYFWIPSYDTWAHGFDQRFPRLDSEHPPYHFDVRAPEHDDTDQYRRLRHASPTDPSGFALSSNTDSSTNDYTRSPDGMRALEDFPFPPVSQDFCGSMLSTIPMWNCAPSLPTLGSSAFPVSQTVPSMRQLQVTPDPEPEDEFMEDRDSPHARINLPEELELSDHLPSPPDSDIGQYMADEEERDCGARDSDNESEFNYKRLRHRKSSLRSARRPASKAVVDPKARVQKHEAIPASASRIKAKKQRTGNVDPESKQFPCTFHHYGCRATFANKNEWKRHVSSQHLQLGFYRCDMGTCAPEQSQGKGYNDFNRKDLFTQHCRRMHAPWSGNRKDDQVSKKVKENFEQELELIRERCWVNRRQAPAISQCGFCGEKFVDGKKTKGWEERMEHVGRHFERDGFKSASEAEDDGLRQWAINEGLVTVGKQKGQYWLVGLEFAERSPSPGCRGDNRRGGVVREFEKDSAVHAATVKEQVDFELEDGDAEAETDAEGEDE